MKNNPCKEYHILMQSILDGVATPSDEAKWREHVDGCPACQALYRELFSLKKAMAGTQAEPPYGLDQIILKEIQTADKQKKLRTIRRRQHLTRSLVGVAAAVAILVAGSWTLSNYGAKEMDWNGADEAAPMEITLEEEGVAEEPEAEMASELQDLDIGNISEYKAETSHSAGGSPGAVNGGVQTDRASILDSLRQAIMGLELPNSYKTCMYLDCDNLPEGRDSYRVNPTDDMAGNMRTAASHLTFYSTADYLNFINGAGLELNFSLELTEEEMQACGLMTGGKMTLIALATPLE